MSYISVQLHAASLVTEAKKARPRLDVMKATMSRTASYRQNGEKMATVYCQCYLSTTYIN